tara:strand:- start:98228 stop:99046 length:819 start_codon:yes stop_codon:yes gene_type:complete
MITLGTLFRYSLFLLLLIATGCAQVSQWASAFDMRGRAGQFNFEWTIKGDKRVAPLQVFDDGRQTWLQFASDMPVPAVFARQGKDDSLLTYRRTGPYVILPGVWSHLVIQGGHAKAHVYRQIKVDAAPSPEAAGTQELAAVTLASEVSASPVELIDVAQPIETAFLAKPADPKVLTIFKVSPADGTMRETLARWAKTAQWDFGPEHWAVDVDIPIVGSARFDTSFEDAVRSLVSSSELGDRPLQPCFYSNRVLRVVPFAQPCDRARALASAS